MLFVLSDRMQLVELVTSVLVVFGIRVDPIDLAQLDAELRAIARSKENKRAFGRAISMIQRNAEIDVVDRWSPYAASC